MYLININFCLSILQKFTNKIQLVHRKFMSIYEGSHALIDQANHVTLKKERSGNTFVVLDLISRLYDLKYEE